MKKILFIISILILTGCDPYYPARFANGYFENVYFSSDFKHHNYDNDTDYVEHKDDAVCPIGSCNEIHYTFGGAFGQYFDNIQVFQDSDRQCLLYSYSRDELIKMKRDAGFSTNSKNDVVLLDKAGIKIISVKEYDRIYQTFQPHIYDKSLCKSKSVVEQK